MEDRARLVSAGTCDILTFVVQKFLLLSIVVAMIGVPILAARDHSPIRAVKKTLFLIVLVNAIYLLLLLFVYPHLH